MLDRAHSHKLVCIENWRIVAPTFTSPDMNGVLANAPMILAFGIRKRGMGFEGKANIVSVGQMFFLKPRPIDSAQPPITSNDGNRAMVVAKNTLYEWRLFRARVSQTPVFGFFSTDPRVSKSSYTKHQFPLSIPYIFTLVDAL